MESLLQELKSELKEIKGTLRELKTENALFRNEILGIGHSATSGPECVGVLETKTLREIVEEIQFDIKSIKIQTENVDHARKRLLEQESLHSEPPSSAPIDRNDGKSSFEEDWLDEYEVPGIRHQKIKEERKWMESKFHEERAKLRDPVDGTSLAGKTVEFISKQLSSIGRASCVLKLSNNLNSDLVTPEQYFHPGTEKRGSTNGIIGRTSEAFPCYLRGDSDRTGFLTTFRINQDLRLAVSCWSLMDGKIYLCLGFTPEGVVTDLALQHFLQDFKPVPDVCASSISSDVKYLHGPLECVINHGKFLARGHMSAGPHSVIHVYILEVGLPRGGCIASNSVGSLRSAGNEARKTRQIVEGSRLQGNDSTYGDLLRIASIPDTPKSLAIVVQLTNCLNVPLKNPRIFIQKCELHPPLPPVEVPPSTRKTFLFSRNAVVQPSFSYDIGSTDLGFVVALRVQGSNNSFSAGIVPSQSIFSGKRMFDSAMDPFQWRTHSYRKLAKATDGEQEIQMRNIRARVSMSDEAKSCLKIRIFAVVDPY